MFIRQTKKSNSKAGRIFFQYVLVQAMRIDGKARQRNLLYLGSHTFLEDKLLRRRIAKSLEERIYQTHQAVLIDKDSTYFSKLDPIYQQHVDEWFAKYIEKQRDQIDTLSTPAKRDTATFEQIDSSSIDTMECMEIGAEWLCFEIAHWLKMDIFFRSRGMNKHKVNMALLSIISRAVFPVSEHKTAQWLRDNSALWELFDTMEKAPDRFALYRTAARISSHFDDFTEHVYKNTMDLFSVRDTLMIYDLTNTYFEGRKLGSIMAKFGRSKEKRSDCRLISFSAVVNKYGFLRYSKIDRGNIADSKTLVAMISQMKKRSSSTRLENTVVLDAGIASEENLLALRTEGIKYVCVSNTRLKDYDDYMSSQMMEIADNRDNKIEIKLIEPKGKPDKWLLVKSQMKKKKEESMLTRSEQSFENKLHQIEQAIHTKRGTKKLEKVWERIGRAKESCKNVHQYYNIKVEHKDGKVIEITWAKKSDKKRKGSGVYFIRTNLESKSEKQIWDIYNTIREVESTFRCLKTDLSIRPIYHQKDKYSTAHLHLGLMAYQLVAAIRHKLKLQDINYDWNNIVRIMNTQKMNTIKMKMKTKEVRVRKISIPEKPVKEIYDAIGITNFPKAKRKHVVYH